MTTARFLAAAITCLLAVVLTPALFAQAGPITFSRTAYTPFSSSVAVGDFNNDSRLDGASLAFTDQDVLVIYRGGSGGSLTKIADYPVDADGDGAWLYTADLNSDGKLDLAITKQFRNELELWWGNGDGTFVHADTLALNRPSPVIAFGDVDGSDTIDVVTFERDDTHTGSWVWLSNGLGSFSTNANQCFIEAPAGTFDFALADFTRDGKLDLMFVSQEALTVRPGSGGCLFGAAVTTPNSLPHGGRIAVGAFNQDTALDVAILTGSAGTGALVHVFTNTGGGRFTKRSTFSAGTADGRDTIAAGDLNNDGVMDLVFTRNYKATDLSPTSTAYALNQGSGIFSAVYVAANHGGGQPILRRFNLDSQMDIILPARDGVVTLMATNAPTNCIPPGAATLKVKICRPSKFATVGTSFLLRAAGDSPVGVARMQVFIDGSKKFDLWNDQVKRTFTVSPGSHKVTVRAYDKYVGYTQTIVYVTAE